MKVRLLALFFAFSFAACSNADFGGSSGGTVQAPAKKKPKPEKVADAADSKDNNQTGTVDETDTDTGQSTSTEDHTATGTSTGVSTDPKPPVGPGSDLTLTINDTDSKLSSFRVQNSVSQQWLPLTWRQGVQQVPGACSPQSKTTLHLEMTTKQSLFGGGGGNLQPGSCNAPLTQTSPTTVDVGVAPSCDKIKGRFTLSCSGSAELKVVP